MPRLIRTGIGMLWASPTTLFGFTLGVACLPFGTRVRRIHHTVEFYEGPIAYLLSRLPIGAIAMTLGHVILGQTATDLDRVREHEWVHVRQCERWGPFFVPAYLLCSLWLAIRKGNMYLDNPFEIEAFEADRLRLAAACEPSEHGSDGSRDSENGPAIM